MTQAKDNFFSMAIYIISVWVALVLLYYSVGNMRERMDILSEKVKVLEDTVKGKKEPRVYTSGIKQTV